jgi:4-hydroxybenzoate polyprenyltransferase
MTNAFRRLIEKIENSPTSFWAWLVSFFGLVLVRTILENWLTGLNDKDGYLFFFELIHNFLFFLLTFLLFWGMLNYFLKTSLKSLSNVLLWGFVIILLPPLVDAFVFRNQNFWSFYIFDGLREITVRFLTFFGDHPDFGITYGVRAEVALALFFIFIYSLIKLTKSNYTALKSETTTNTQKIKFKILAKSLAITVIAYAIFFLLATLPSWIAIKLGIFSKGFLNITGLDVAHLFFGTLKIFSLKITGTVPVLLYFKMSLIYALLVSGILILGSFLYYREKFISLVKNARYPQLIYHWGLVVTGMGLAVIYTGTQIEINFFNFLAFILLETAVCLSWLSSVISNDIVDINIDRLTPNKNRPLVRNIFTTDQYQSTGWVFFSASILFGAIISFKIALLLLAYQSAAWIYSCWPLRLKRFAFVSTFLSALALLMILFSGYILVSPEQNIVGLPFAFISLLIFGCILILPIKDFKDIEGDKKEGVHTIPVLLGEKWSKVLVGSGTFISFLLSVVVFNNFQLFWLALLCGVISFWIILSSGENKKATYKRLPWWIMGVILVYFLVLAKMFLWR